MKYVRIDAETETLEWDAYFEYLNATRNQFPAQLFSYATNWEHYSLDGQNTLHDAWLTEVRFDYQKEAVTLGFLGARRDRTHVFRYQGVASYVFNLSVNYRSGDRDLLAHEFRVEDGSIVHELVFAGEQSVVLRCSNVTPVIELLTK
jgi:hypothetical protein